MKNKMKPKLPEGCIQCLEGRKLVLFMTGICRQGCFYCPLPESRMGKDVVFANERRLSNVNAINEAIEEAELSDSTGMGITGGDPLVVLDRTIDYIKAFKKRFGGEFHCHIYLTTKEVTKDKLERLGKAGLDEVRLHPQFLKEDLSEELKKMDFALELKKKFKWKVGIEIPIIPDCAERTIIFLDKIKDKVDFMNFNELEMSVINAPALMKKGMTWKNDSTAVKRSEKDALKVVTWCQDNVSIPINFCTASQKNQFQYKNRLRRRLKNIMKDYDIETTDGGLYRAALYLPEMKPGFHYGHKLENLDKVRRDKMLKKLSMLRARLMDDFEIPENLIELDTQKIRILTSTDIAKALKKPMKLLGLDAALIEELPTYDKQIMQLEWI
ncbi:MAG: radical SAM protein [Nanoarchaeota archaeon]|nr:radical SAM protein [Nanoarchaeota archaeon]